MKSTEILKMSMSSHIMILRVAYRDNCHHIIQSFMIDDMTCEAIKEVDVDDLDSLNISNDFSIKATSVTDSIEVPKKLEELQESNMSSMDMNLCEKQPTLEVSM